MLNTGRRGTTVIALIAASITLFSPLAQAQTQEADVDAEEALQLVQEAAPLDVPLASGGGFDDGAVTVISASADVEVTVPEAPEDLITLDPGSTNGPSTPTVAISLPEQVSTENGQVSESGAVVYPDDGAGVDVVVQPVEDGSVRINTVVHEADSPHQFTYQLSLPDSATLQQQQDGSIAILNGPTFIGGVAAPWATDAAGNDVPTTYQINGHALTQHVQPTPETQYPIVADPWIGIALVSKTVWQWQASYGGYTLSVYPTWWGRAGVYPTLGVGTYFWLRSAFWDEVKAKTPGTRENTNSMRDQFYCHVDVVRLRAPNKESWNLDTWRPSVSYATMLARQCNP